MPSLDSLRPMLAPQRAIRAGEVVLVVALAAALADLTWELVPQPQGAAGLASESAQSAGATAAASDTGAAGSSRALPGPVEALFGTAPSPAEQGKAVSEPVRETELNLTLKGILAHRGGGKQLALIAKGDGDETVYGVGDTVPGGAEIVRIESRRVILRRNGVTEALNLEVQELEGGSAGRVANGGGGGGIRRTGEHQREVARSTVRRKLENLPTLLQQAKAVPHSENGRKAGFRIVNIQGGSVFEDLGLKEGDIIQGVNGKQIRTPSQALKAYRELKSASNFKVRLKRNGQPVTLNYDVK